MVIIATYVVGKDREAKDRCFEIFKNEPLRVTINVH